MSSIGPDLPPHLLAKRKRQQEEGETTTSTPDLPVSRSPDGCEKRQKVLGPAAPPASLNERPTVPANEDESDSDSSEDGYGPSVPTSESIAKSYARQEADREAREAPAPKEEPSIKRDDWMMVPPTADGLARNLDPSKRAKTFRSGPGAAKTSSGKGGMDAMWTETPGEKRKRLADQVLGVSKPAGPGSRPERAEGRDKKDEEAARRIKEYNVSITRHLVDDYGSSILCANATQEKHRGKSLVEQHKSNTKSAEEDDPSKRAFDREKDIESGTLMKSKKDLMKQAANFGSKFSGGKYL